MENLRKLARAQNDVPDSERKLEACTNCKIILSQSQFKRRGCPNDCVNYETTPDFTGLISLMQPQSSWVAKWNQLQDLTPGIYAIHIE